ncbi:MAG: hypothetical protein V1656_00755 [Candidatus Jorgensenbacteria bacterium]
MPSIINRTRKNSKPYKILKTVLLAGGILVLGTLSPAGGAAVVKSLIKNYVRNKRFRREYFLQDLKRLQDRKLISYRELPDGTVSIELTKLGKKKTLSYKLDDMNLKSGAWDKKWRLVIFDIPTYQKTAREALRCKIREMGFYPLQKSVFITPYPCEDEIDFISTVFEIDRNNVLILEISKFEGEEKLRNHFKI